MRLWRKLYFGSLASGPRANSLLYAFLKLDTHTKEAYSPAPTLQSSTPPIAHYGNQQPQRPAAPVHVPHVAQTPAQNRGQGTARAAPATGAHGAVLAKFDSDNKCQTQRSACLRRKQRPIEKKTARGFVLLTSRSGFPGLWPNPKGPTKCFRLILSRSKVMTSF